MRFETNYAKLKRLSLRLVDCDRNWDLKERSVELSCIRRIKTNSASFSVKIVASITLFFHLIDTEPSRRFYKYLLFNKTGVSLISLVILHCSRLFSQFIIKPFSPWHTVEGWTRTRPTCGMSLSFCSLKILAFCFSLRIHQPYLQFRQRKNEKILPSVKHNIGMKLQC